MTIDEARIVLENEIKSRGFEIHYRSSNTGCVWFKRKRCEIPFAKTRSTLYIVAHELFHCIEERKTKVYINEMFAEKFAHNKIRELGFSVPRRQTRRAKKYVAWKLTKARCRGLKEIDKTVKQYI